MLKEKRFKFTHLQIIIMWEQQDLVWLDVVLEWYYSSFDKCKVVWILNIQLFCTLFQKFIIHHSINQHFAQGYILSVNLRIWVSKFFSSRGFWICFTLLFKESKSNCYRMKCLALTVCSAYHSKHGRSHAAASECLGCWANLSQCQE